MKATELRIGNLVWHIGLGEAKVGELRKDAIVLLNPKDDKGFKYEPMNNFHRIEPIPLTEEWLLKFGFNKEYQKGYIGIDVCNSDFVLTEPLKMGEWQTNYTFQFETGSVPKFKEIEYVHQLQNLYFALTGEELILKN